MRLASDARIGVIGAGPSGLAAVKALLDEGFTDVVVWDRGSRVGGNWVFDADSGHSSVFETTHIISSKDFSQYHDFPMPDAYPDYPGHAQLAAYFQAYADHFGLERFVRFRTLVERCEPRADGGWQVALRDEATGQTSHDEVAYLVVANGHHWQPRWPDYPGRFTGTYLHSHDFKRAEPFAGQRVLVIGGGNSACDVAVETSRVSAHTDISMRRGYWIVPKFLFGRPTDHIHHTTIQRFGWVPLRLRQKAFELLLKVLVGPNERYGMPVPDHPIFATHPTLNSELHYFLRHGEVTARPDVARFEGRTVHFVDGTSADYDAVVACTGFRIAHPFFDPGLLDYSRGPVPLYLKMLPADVADVAFVGLFQPFGCIWPAAELQAKILARGLAGRWQPPKDLRRAIAQELRHPDVPQIDTPRHTVTVDEPRFRRRLLAHLPDDFVRREPVAPVAAGRE
ncbi:flavin-containing monooxygenase [Egicoccus sp. AB-alg2]|uniref:flavin-containing monooxygenase n=1 Tax=Egicoccus sp. AB-alg2 TaxID=3242693 RepID=UPI00359CC01B